MAPKIDDFRTIWRHIPQNSDGFTTEAEFIRVFSSSTKADDVMNDGVIPFGGDMRDAPSAGGRLGSESEFLSQEELKLLLGTAPAAIGTGVGLEALDHKIYERLKFKLQPHTQFRKVWEGNLHGER